MGRWKDKDFWTGLAGQAVDGRKADWPETRFPLNGRLNTRTSQAFRRMCSDGPEPWMILVANNGNGALAAWDDRLAIVKAGVLTGTVAGATGGERTGVFYFTDVNGLEFTSGFLEGVLEVSVGGGPAADRGQFAGLWTRGEDPAKSTNAFPMDKSDYKAAREGIDELRRRIGEAKRPHVTVNLTTPPASPRAPTPTPTPTEPDVLDQIKRLADLHAAGALTDEEFAAKKADLLGRL